MIAQGAVDTELGTLGEILGNLLGTITEHHAIDILRDILVSAVGLSSRLAECDGEVQNGRTVVRVLQHRIAGDIADDIDVINSHVSFLPCVRSHIRWETFPIPRIPWLLPTPLNGISRCIGRRCETSRELIVSAMSRLFNTEN